MQENHVLADLNGLQGLSSIEGNCILSEQNLVLDDLTGLSQVTAIEGALFISLPNLIELNGLNNVQYVGGDLELSDMILMSNLDPLESLSAVGGSVAIHFNASLGNVNGLYSLESVGQNLAIQNNSALSTCCGVLPVIEENGVVGEVILELNSDGCNSEEEIALDCMESVHELTSLELSFITNQKRREARIQSNLDAEYELWSMDGKEIAQGKLIQGQNTTLAIDRAGLYGMSVYSNGQVVVRRFAMF